MPSKCFNYTASANQTRDECPRNSYLPCLAKMYALLCLKEIGRYCEFKLSLSYLKLTWSMIWAGHHHLSHSRRLPSYYRQKMHLEAHGWSWKLTRKACPRDARSDTLLAEFAVYQRISWKLQWEGPLLLKSFRLFLPPFLSSNSYSRKLLQSLGTSSCTCTSWEAPRIMGEVRHQAELNIWVWVICKSH